jgi:hypothetical protein
MEENKYKFDWNEIITKSVQTSDGKHVGHVDGLTDRGFIIKDKILHARYYLVPRDKLESYEHGKVLLNVSEDILNSRYKRDRPGYFDTATS